MTGILKFGLALPAAVLAALALVLSVGGVFDWALGPVVALVMYCVAMVTWRIAARRARAERQQAELASIAIHSERQTRLAPGIKRAA
ncbi:MAG: hypothetical protein WEC33_01340 [Dehalococcoidia bacterium]